MADRIADLRAEWVRARDGALEFIQAMPESLIGYKPVPEVFSFAGQFIHIASTTFRFAARLGGLELPAEAQPIEEPCDKARLAEYVRASYEFMISVIEAVRPETLDETVQFSKWTMPRVVGIGKALEHHAHHRGQTVIYFRLNGLQPPPEHLF